MVQFQVYWTGPKLAISNLSSTDHCDIVHASSSSPETKYRRSIDGALMMRDTMVTRTGDRSIVLIRTPSPVARGPLQYLESDTMSESDRYWTHCYCYCKLLVVDDYSNKFGCSRPDSGFCACRLRKTERADRSSEYYTRC